MSAFGGRAHVDLTARDKDLQEVVSRVESRLKGFQDRLQGVGRIARNMLLIGGGAVAGFIKAASDAEEEANKFEAVFGTQADAAEDFASRLGNSIKRSTMDLKAAMSTFQAFFVGMGFDPAKAREMSQTVTELSADMASFHNLSDQESVGRFISALSGSTEVMDQLGINIKAAAIDQELLAMGLNKTSQQATEQEKAVARLNVIMKAMTSQGAVGDAERTSGSFANQMRELTGDAKEAAAALGRAFLPAAGEVVKWAVGAAEGVQKWAEENQKLIVRMTASAAAILAVTTVLPHLVAGVRATIAVVKALGLSIAFLAANPVVAAVTAVGLLVGGIIALVAWMRRTREDADATGQAIEGFAGRFPDMGGVVSEIDRLSQKFKDLRAESENADAGVAELEKARDAAFELANRTERAWHGLQSLNTELKLMAAKGLPTSQAEIAGLADVMGISTFEAARMLDQFGGLQGVINAMTAETRRAGSAYVHLGERLDEAKAKAAAAGDEFQRVEITPETRQALFDIEQSLNGMTADPLEKSLSGVNDQIGGIAAKLQKMLDEGLIDAEQFDHAMARVLDTTDQLKLDALDIGDAFFDFTATPLEKELRRIQELGDGMIAKLERSIGLDPANAEEYRRQIEQIRGLVDERQDMAVDDTFAGLQDEIFDFSATPMERELAALDRQVKSLEERLRMRVNVDPDFNESDFDAAMAKVKEGFDRESDEIRDRFSKDEEKEKKEKQEDPFTASIESLKGLFSRIATAAGTPEELAAEATDRNTAATEALTAEMRQRQEQARQGLEDGLRGQEQATADAAARHDPEMQGRGEPGPPDRTATLGEQQRQLLQKLVTLGESQREMFGRLLEIMPNVGTFGA